MEEENNQTQKGSLVEQKPVQEQADSLPPIKQLFSQSWEVFSRSLLRLFLLAIVSLSFALVLGFFAIIVFIALGVGTNFFASIKEAGPAALAAIPLNTYLVGGLAVLVLFLIYLVVSIAIKAALIIVVSEYEVSIGRAIRHGFGFIIPLSFLGSIIFILDFGGIFVFLLPALLFSFFFMFAGYEIVLNGKGFYQGLQRSLLIVSKRFGEILVRLVIYALLYILIAFVIPGLLERIAPDAAVVVGLLSVVVNALLGWYGLVFSITLYKQARAGLENEEGASLRWVWVVAVLGWIIFVLIAVLGFKFLGSKLGEEFKKGVESEISKSKDRQEKFVEISPQAKQLIDSGLLKLSTADQIASKPNITQSDRDQIKGLIDGALLDLNKAIQLEPDNTIAWYGRGRAYKHLIKTVNNADKWAIDSFRKAVELDPDNYRPYFQLGQIYYLQENYDLAIQNFQKVIELEPELANGYFNLGVAYKKYGALTEARIALEKARKLLPENHKDIYRIDKELLGT